MEITEKFYASDRAVWRRWLEVNHAKKKEVWLAYFKKTSGKSGISYQDSVDEALCFGWIDGQMKGIDSESYALRFSPRRAKSSWSAANVSRFKHLLKDGFVHEAGRRAFDTRILLE